MTISARRHSSCATSGPEWTAPPGGRPGGPLRDGAGSGLSSSAAAERPPGLKAIFVSGGHYDFYESTYHGGVMWFMPRAAREGRGGDSGWAFTDGVKSRMLETCSPEEIEKRVAERLNDPDMAAWPDLVHVLNHPKNHEAWFGIVMNEVDGEWYEERNPITLAPRIDIPPAGGPPRHPHGLPRRRPPLPARAALHGGGARPGPRSGRLSG